MTAATFMTELQKPVLQLLGEKAERDVAFRTRLLKQPKAAIADVLGSPVPDNVSVVMHENTPTQFNVVLDPTLLAQVSAQGEAGGPLAVILKRAYTDPSFRKRLIADPRAAAFDAAGLEVPQGLNVKVYENTASTIHLVLPPLPSADGELSDVELEQVAGGSGKGGIKPPPQSSSNGFGLTGYGFVAVGKKGIH